MRRASGARRETALAALGLGLGTLAMFWRVLQGRVLVPWDILRIMAPWGERGGPIHNALISDPVRLYVPWRTLLHDALQQGRLPWWDPWVMAGAPFLANSQAAILYPPNWVYGAMPVDRATTLLTLFHFWLAGLGAFLLLRRGPARLAFPTAMLAAVGFAFSGFDMVWAEFPSFMAVWAWTPWMALAMCRLVAGGSFPALVALAVVTALAALAGHPQLLVYQLMAVGILGAWLVVRLVGAAGWRRGLGRGALGVAGLGLGGMLAAPQLLATLEAGPLIVRGREPLISQLSGALHLHELSLAALPVGLGDSQLGNWKAPGNENEVVVFCGALCLLLAPLALARWREPFVQALLSVELLSFLLAMGTPVYVLAYNFVPEVSHFRSISRATAIHAFALPILAAIGADVLLSWVIAGRRRATWAWLAGAAATVAILAVTAARLAQNRAFSSAYLRSEELALVVPVGLGLLAVALASLATRAAAPGQRGAPRRRAPRSATLALATLPVLLLGELYLAYGHYSTMDPGPSPLTRTVVTDALAARGPNHRWVAVGLDEISGNNSIVYHLRTVEGSDSFILSDFGTYYDGLENHGSSLYLNEANQLVDGGVLASPKAIAMGLDMFVTDSPPQGLSPMLAARHPHLVAESGADRVYTLDAAPIVHALDTGSALDRPTVDARLADDGTATADVAAPATFTLVYAESWYPGWSVSVDGHPAALLKVDQAFLGVVVPAGHHTVRFSYVPDSLGPGLAVAGAALVILGGAAGLAAMRRRQSLPARPMRPLRGTPAARR